MRVLAFLKIRLTQEMADIVRQHETIRPSKKDNMMLIRFSYQDPKLTHQWHLNDVDSIKKLREQVELLKNENSQHT